MQTTPRPHLFSTQLVREWEALRRRPAELAVARSWRTHVGDGPLARALDGLQDLDEIIRATNAAGNGDEAGNGDGALLQLVELARFEQLAGRIVVQRLLPGLIARAARYRSRRDDIDPVEFVVGAAWIAIRRYDTTTRRRYVAASLISDAIFQAFRQPLRRRWVSEVAVPLAQFDDRAAPATSVTTLEQLADVIRLARSRGVPAADLQLVRDLVQVGSANLLAVREGVTPRTIRNRRDRAVAHIRDAVHAA
ncbi:MAG: hypothetical protein ABWZ99_03890 [Ilumatobacteraceae bacterium]